MGGTDSAQVIVFPPALVLGTMLLSIMLNFVWPLHFPRMAWMKIDADCYSYSVDS